MGPFQHFADQFPFVAWGDLGLDDVSKILKWTTRYELEYGHDVGYSILEELEQKATSFVSYKYIIVYCIHLYLYIYFWIYMYNIHTYV